MGPFIVLLIFVASGYALYKHKHFFCGATLLFLGYVILFHFIDEASKKYLTFTKDFTYMDFYLWEGVVFFLVLVALYGKAIIDDSRYEKEEARRREEESKKPVTINFKITSTTVEQN